MKRMHLTVTAIVMTVLFLSLPGKREALATLIAFRDLDGGTNNLGNPDWGRAGENLIRVSPVAYDDGISSPAHPSFPNPREISNIVFNQTQDLPDARGLSDWVWTWGQFIDHDIDYSPTQSNSPESFDIMIPIADPVYTPGSVIPFTRSIFDTSTGTDTNNPRQQTNLISAWLDASQVYGNDTDRADWLRTKSDGKLKVTLHPTGDLLPTWDASAPFMAGPLNSATFVAGDVRANEQVGLTSLHTLFVREHNRLASVINETHMDLPMNSVLRDEEIYQRARKIIGAEIQAITYNEFLPMLGVTLDPYTVYDAMVDPSIANEFAAAGYRMGHSQVNDVLMRVKEDGTPIDEGHLNLFDAFFDPSRITDEGGIEPILLGLTHQVQQATDAKIVDGLRNLLFTGPSPPGPIANGTDLASLNIQRGRDHGLSDYKTARLFYGLPAVSSFADITSDVVLQGALANIYTDVDQIDLWVGILSEDLLPNASIGELTHAILGDQFTRLRDGDRFWYQNDFSLSEWAAPESGSLHDNAFAWLGDLRLSDIILQNTSMVSMQTNVFVTVPEPSTLALFGIGIIGLLGYCWRRRNKQTNQ